MTLTYEQVRAEVDAFNAFQREGGRDPEFLAVVIANYDLSHHGPLDLRQRVSVIVAKANRYVTPVHAETVDGLREGLKRACRSLP